MTKPKRSGKGRSHPPGPAQAADAYNAALKEYPKGSWHDETLRSGPVDGAKCRRAVPRQVSSRATRKRAGRNGRLRARPEARARPIGNEFSTIIPESTLRGRALPCRRAALREGRRSPSREIEAAWKEATALFNRLCQRYPKSSLPGRRLVRQIDTALERMFDLNWPQAWPTKLPPVGKGSNVQVTTRADGHLTEEALHAAAEAVDEASLSLAAWARTDVKRADALLDDLTIFTSRGNRGLRPRGFRAGPPVLTPRPRPAGRWHGSPFRPSKVGLHILKVSCKRDEHSWDPEVLKVANGPTKAGPKACCHVPPRPASREGRSDLRGDSFPPSSTAPVQRSKPTA